MGPLAAPTFVMKTIQFRLLASASLLLAMVAAAACGSELMVITLADEDSEIVINVNRDLEIALDSDPTSGFSWVLDEHRADLLVLQGEEFVEGVEGASGQQVFTFISRKGGGFTPVNLSYRSTSDSEAEPRDTFHVVVLVRAPGGLGPPTRR